VNVHVGVVGVKGEAKTAGELGNHSVTLLGLVTDGGRRVRLSV